MVTSIAYSTDSSRQDGEESFFLSVTAFNHSTGISIEAYLTSFYSFHLSFSFRVFLPSGYLLLQRTMLSFLTSFFLSAFWGVSQLFALSYFSY